MKNIGFLSFGWFSQAPGSKVRTPADLTLPPAPYLSDHANSRVPCANSAGIGFLGKSAHDPTGEPVSDERGECHPGLGRHTSAGTMFSGPPDPADFRAVPLRAMLVDEVHSDGGGDPSSGAMTDTDRGRLQGQ